jgi:hypothetical protein
MTKHSAGRLTEVLPTSQATERSPGEDISSPLDLLHARISPREYANRALYPAEVNPGRNLTPDELAKRGLVTDQYHERLLRHDICGYQRLRAL